MNTNEILFSLIIPSRGTRPVALEQAIVSVLKAADNAGLNHDQFEVLIGFDGQKGERVVTENNVYYYDLPEDKNWGNGIRNILLKRSKGEKVVFLDDDNELTSSAFQIYLQYFKAELIIARIDVSRAFACEYLPQDVPGRSLVRQGNIDPLCLCLSRELVVDRCGGWKSSGGYEADYLNMLKYYRRAKTVEVVTDIVGIYDSGQGLDKKGINFRQKQLFDSGKKSQVIH
ncbi:glycosyltransferase family A protein [Desulfonatronovibrio magnus]|uniref:glycosyltransferase family A protein n=1 Tax=Desulfonatronovibrio magnus TaxID=698827 RepID=UPI0005EB1173|nr:glycosyltransferase family A protein [Desulfonatronovibrio magnus]